MSLEPATWSVALLHSESSEGAYKARIEWNSGRPPEMHLLATTLLSLLVPATPAFAENEPETNAKGVALGLPPLLSAPPSWYVRCAFKFRS
jgi:hypothetical protein